ncbi:MAG: glycosyltransferase [Actinomycetota bacterium]|nr:glycosyltransferase [Actinomycetota bacterium]
MNIGGPARHALLLTRGLAEEYPTLLAAGRPTADEGELRDPDLPVVSVPLVRPVHPMADAQSLAAVRRLLVEERPALLHTHMAKAGTVGRMAALSTRPRMRTVHTFHGHVLEGYFGAFAQKAFVETERRLARRTDVLIAVSPEIRDELSALGIGRPSQYHVISVGLDLAPFLAVTASSGDLRAELALSAQTPLIGIVGRLVPIKDHVTALEVIRNLPGAHLAVLGDGELRSDLERRTRDLGLADRVHFRGWCPDLPAAVSDLDVVMLTSKNEGTPVALIEASAAAKPVVATDVGGTCSVVLDGVTGYLAPAGDGAGIARHVGALLDDPAQRQRLGRAGRDHVRHRFGHDRLIREVGDLYSCLIPRRRRVGFNTVEG